MVDEDGCLHELGVFCSDDGTFDNPEARIKRGDKTKDKDGLL